MNFVVEKKDSLEENVFPEAFDVGGKHAFMNPEDHEANVAQDEFLGLGLATTLGLSD